jgi:hypothetical protein
MKSEDIFGAKHMQAMRKEMKNKQDVHKKQLGKHCKLL